MTTHIRVALDAMAEPISGITAEIDRLGDEIAELSARLDAATAQLLDLIREFDAREGWNTGFRSCAAWLSWRVGLDVGTARERVRVARALGTLPRLAHALARGELSYAKVRALTRAATAKTEERLLAVGKAGTAEHVEASCAAGDGWTGSPRRRRPRGATRAGRCTCIKIRDGMCRGRGQLTPETGALSYRRWRRLGRPLPARARDERGRGNGSVSFYVPAETHRRRAASERPRPHRGRRQLHWYRAGLGGRPLPGRRPRLPRC